MTCNNKYNIYNLYKQIRERVSMSNPTYDKMKRKIENAKNFITEKKVLIENNYLPLNEKSKIYIKNYLDEIWRILNA